MLSVHSATRLSASSRRRRCEEWQFHVYVATHSSSCLVMVVIKDDVRVCPCVIRYARIGVNMEMMTSQETCTSIVYKQARSTTRSTMPLVRALLAMTTGNEEWRSLAKNECLLVGDMRDKEDEGRRKVCGALVYIRVDALELQVLQLAVCPSARRRGIGRALVKRAVAEAGEDANVLLEVADSNQAAKALYFREGFIVQGRRRAYYRDGADALLMTKLPS